MVNRLDGNEYCVRTKCDQKEFKESYENRTTQTDGIHTAPDAENTYNNLVIPGAMDADSYHTEPTAKETYNTHVVRTAKETDSKHIGPNAKETDSNHTVPAARETIPAKETVVRCEGHDTKEMDYQYSLHIRKEISSTYLAANRKKVPNNEVDD